MSTYTDYKNRQVIPRWHPFDIARLLGYTDPIRVSLVPKLLTPESYLSKEITWLENKTISHALDFIGSALLANDITNTNAKIACDFVLTNQSKTSQLGIDIALSYAKRVNQQQENGIPKVVLNRREEIQKTISSLRKYLSLFPYDSIRWVDLAFYYTLISKVKKANRCISVALSLGHNNRFILRSASRFFLHSGDDPEHAIYYLRKADFSREDPWIVSAELSICEAISRRSILTKFAPTLASNENIHPHNRTELCASIGTLEFNHGSIKKARRYFECSLIAPNENTIAQIEWIQSKENLNLNSRRELEVPALFEADMWQMMKKGDFNGSFEAAISWQNFQPFSSMPGLLGSYIASLGMQDENRALEIIDKTIISSPNDPMILNNKACSLATLDKVDEAIDIINKIDFSNLSRHKIATITATYGLINYRLGKIEEARNYYDEAIKIFESLRETGSISVASLIRGREEDRINSDQADKYLDRAYQLAKKLDKKEIVSYVDRIKLDRKKH